VARPATTSTTVAGSVAPTGSGTGVHTTPVVTLPPTTPAPTGCTASTLVLELSDAGAVTMADVPVDLGQAAPIALAGSGSFGAAEGSPAGWVAATTGPGVAEVRLVEDQPVGASPTPLDQMAPIDGTVVLAGPGDGLNGASLQALSASGAVLSTEPVADTVPVTCPTTTTTTTTVAPTTTTTSTVTPITIPATTTVPPTTTGRPVIAPIEPASRPASPTGR